MVSKEIILPSVLGFFGNFILTTLLFFFPILLVSRGLTGLEIGILMSVFVGSGLLFSFHSGIASDRHSIRNVSMTSLFLLAMFFYFMAAAKTFTHFLILFFIGGMSKNLGDIAITSYVLKFTEKHNRGENVGFFTLTGILAAALGFFIGGLLIFKLGFESSLKIGAIASFIIGISSLLLKKNQSFYFPAAKYKQDFFRKKIIIYAAILVLFSFHWGAEHTSYALFLKNNLSLNTFQSGIYMSIPLIFYGIAAYFFGKKNDNGFNYRKIAYLGLLLAGTGHVLMVFGNVYFSFLMRVMHEIGDGIFDIYLIGAIHKYFPKNRLGGSTGFVTGVTIFGSIIGSMVFGYVGQAFGYGWPLLISGVVMLLVLVLLKLFKVDIE